MVDLVCLVHLGSLVPPTGKKTRGTSWMLRVMRYDPWTLAVHLCVPQG